MRGAPGPSCFVTGVTDTYKKYSAAKMPSGPPEGPAPSPPPKKKFFENFLRAQWRRGYPFVLNRSPGHITFLVDPHQIGASGVILGRSGTILAQKLKIVKNINIFAPSFFQKGRRAEPYPNCLLKTCLRRPGPVGSPSWAIYPNNFSKNFEKFWGPLGHLAPKFLLFFRAIAI